jgi:hypothetical protein
MSPGEEGHCRRASVVVFGIGAYSGEPPDDLTVSYLSELALKGEMAPHPILVVIYGAFPAVLLLLRYELIKRRLEAHRLGSDLAKGFRSAMRRLASVRASESVRSPNRPMVMSEGVDVVRKGSRRTR